MHTLRYQWPSLRSLIIPTRELLPTNWQNQLTGRRWGFDKYPLEAKDAAFAFLHFQNAIIFKQKFNFPFEWPTVSMCGNSQTNQSKMCWSLCISHTYSIKLPLPSLPEGVFFFSYLLQIIRETEHLYKHGKCWKSIDRTGRGRQEMSNTAQWRWSRLYKPSTGSNKLLVKIDIYIFTFQ